MTETKQTHEERFPSVTKWLVACSACGRKGLDPDTDWSNPTPLPGFGAWLKPELARLYDPLRLDASGLCADCAAVAGRSTQPAER
jgi:hypothetical protein